MIQQYPVCSVRVVPVVRSIFHGSAAVPAWLSKAKRVATAVLILGGLAMPLVASAAAPGLPAFTSTPAPGGGQTYSLSIQTLLLMTALTFLPAVLLMMTSFTRIIIVLSLLRQAIGTMSAPPNQVLVGLSLFLTFFVMAPVLDRVYTEAYQPYAEQKIDFMQALDKGAVPLKTFMLRQTRQEDLALFVKLSNSGPLQGPEAVPMKILVPAYVISELKTAFQIGFVVFIPFLIIDMVVASVLMSMGMMMLSPVVISLPFKLMLFVLVDGWNLLVGSLVQSFYT
jgi:flagellar biosynthetic protein FliP